MIDRLLFWMYFQWLVFCGAVDWISVWRGVLCFAWIFFFFKALAWVSDNTRNGGGPPCAA